MVMQRVYPGNRYNLHGRNIEYLYYGFWWQSDTSIMDFDDRVRNYGIFYSMSDA